MSRPSLVGNDLLSLHVTEGNPEQPRTCHARRTRDLMTCCMCVSSVLVITRLELLQISFEAIIKSGIKTKQHQSFYHFYNNSIECSSGSCLARGLC